MRGSSTVKRLFDMTVAACLLLATSPIMGLVWLWLRINRQPAIYRGVRLGRGARPFVMYKFQTMVPGAEKLGGPEVAAADTRVTRQGRVLRRLKLDELPQLVNVLRGEMSMVGPRPPVPEELSLYAPEDMVAFSVRPGITDWASLEFADEAAILSTADDTAALYRSQIHPVKMRLVRRYIEHGGVRQDMEILARTALLVIRRRRSAAGGAGRGDEDQQVRDHYARRAAGQGKPVLYAPDRPEVRIELERRDRLIDQWLATSLPGKLESIRVLDIGCGAGDDLRRWVARGVRPEHACGIDLVPERVARAREAAPALDVRCGSAASLPWPDQSFEVVTQSTAFSSMPSPTLRRAVAAEIQRVLAPRGVVIWYDFWINPTNRDTVSQRLSDVRALFPGFRLQAHRVTLAPPLSRPIAPRFPGLARALSAVPFLCSHNLVFMTRRG